MRSYHRTEPCIRLDVRYLSNCNILVGKIIDQRSQDVWARGITLDMSCMHEKKISARFIWTSCTEIVRDIRKNPFNFQSRSSRLTVLIGKSLLAKYRYNYVGQLADSNCIFCHLFQS